MRKTVSTMMVLVGVLVMLLWGNCEVASVYANGLEDTIETTAEAGLLDGVKDQTLSDSDKEFADFFKDQRGPTGEQMEKASKTLSPVLNLLGYISGGVVVFTTAAIFCITALDLCYLAIPPVRNILYKAGTDGTGAYTGGMPGGGYGMGAGGMMRGGVGGAAGGTRKPTQWVSDEAIACAALLGGSATTQPSMMGGGMGMGAMGGMGVAQAGPERQYPLRTVIGMYFKKRLMFMILFAVCIVVLTSSLLMNTGVNIANLILKLINMVNGKIE